MSDNTNTAATVETAIVILEEEWTPSHPHFKTHTHRFTIQNKNDGETIHIQATDDALISHVIDRMYHKFNLQRQPEDRLHCKLASNAADVFHYAGLTVAEYVEQGHCPHLHWVFAGGSGGA